jgi:hypothetical protein
MRTLLFILLLPIFATSQDSLKIGKIVYDTNYTSVIDCKSKAQKTYKDSTGFYRIEYEYCNCFAMIPATYPAGQPHYDATITVYRVDSIDTPNNTTTITQRICDPFKGTYVANGCFEDTAKMQVEKAKKIGINYSRY